MQLKDIRKKFYSSIAVDDFWRIVRCDPTYDEVGHPQKKGKYVQWLLNAYNKEIITSESLNECTFLLDVFNRYRSLLAEKDIMRYDTLQKLRDVLEPYLDDPYADVHETSKAVRIRKIKEGAEKVYEDEEWAVFVPHTWEASRYYGKGTRWCTAYDSSDSFFNQYNNKGPLYININRQTKKKWQFHFETQTYCNERDERVSLDDVPLSDGLRQFYHLTVSKHIPTTSAHTFADAIAQWNADDGEETLHFGGLEGDTSCIETLVLPQTYSDYSQMFQECRTITSLDLGRWDVSGARSMDGMFYMCENLTLLRLDGWNMRGVQEFNGMFGLCDHLNTLTLDRCHLPDTTHAWDIFDCCRNLRVVNMHDCDMQSVRFVLREIVCACLYENVTLHLTHDSEEQRAYKSLTSVIDKAEEAMQAQNLQHIVGETSDIIQYIQELLDADSHLRENPLYFEQLSSGINFRINGSLSIIERMLKNKVEMNYTSRRHGPLMLTRPDVEQYKEKVDNRYRQAQALMILLGQIAEHTPQRAQEMIALKQRLSAIPPVSQISIGKELKEVGFSNRWHVTIPAISRLIDRVTNNTRKGVEHLRYTAKECAGIFFAIIFLIAIFGFLGFIAAVNPVGEYWLMGLFAYAIIRAAFSTGWKTLKQKRELKALGWFILSIVLYLLLIVYVIRPIWKHYHDNQSDQTEKVVYDTDEDRPEVEPLIVGNDTLSEADVHEALRDNVPFSNHMLPNGQTVAEWCARAMQKDYLQRHPDANIDNARTATLVIENIMCDMNEKELRYCLYSDHFWFWMNMGFE